MTVVDESSRVPKVDEDALRSLARVLDQDGVVAAMLIGSQARGTAGPLSDIDIAVWLDEHLGEDERTQYRLKLLGLAVEALGTDEIDLVLLNNAPPLIRHRAIRDGRKFLERDSISRVRLEARAIVEYLDTEPLREELARGLKKSIREGRFGRSPKR